MDYMDKQRPGVVSRCATAYYDATTSFKDLGPKPHLHVRFGSAKLHCDFAARQPGLLPENAADSWTVFATLYFLRNLQMGPTSQIVTLYLSGETCKGQTVAHQAHS